MVVRERAATVVKMYMDRADKLQQDWQQQHPDSKAGPANPDYAQAESGVKEEGCFSMDAAVSLQENSYYSFILSLHSRAMRPCNLPKLYVLLKFS